MKRLGRFAERRQRGLVVANGFERASERAFHDAVQNKNDGRVDDEQHANGEQRRGAAGTLEQAGHAGDAAHAVGQPGFVDDDEPDGLGKAERDDGEIVVAQPQRDQPDRPGGKPRDDAGGEE